MGEVVGGNDGVEATLAWLRRTGGRATLSALASDGSEAQVPTDLGLPPSAAPLVAHGLTGLEAVLLEDRPAVIRAYERSRRRGTASVAVRTVELDRVQIHFVDLRSTHDAVLIAALPNDADAPPVEDEPERRPRRATSVRLDDSGAVLSVEDNYTAMLGWLEADIVGKSALPLLHPDDHEQVLENWIEVLGSPGQRCRYRSRHLRPDGSHIWIEVTNLNRLHDARHGDVLSEMVDISDEMAVHEALREREQLLRQLTDALPVGVVQFLADRTVVHENEQLRVIVGASGVAGLMAATVDDDRAALDAALVATASGGTVDPVEVHLDADRVVRVTLRPLFGADGHPTGGLACVDDVTEAARLRRQLELRATFDELTACFSRSAILRALDDLTAQPPGTGVVFVDLDRFKPVNDEFGHAAGDELLAEVGARLRAAVRDIDLVGRLGGDEFLIVCPGIAGPDVVEAIARRVMDKLAVPLPLADDVVRPRASIGVAWAATGTDPAALVARADAAMYESKRQSRLEPNTPTKLTISPG